MNPRRFCWLVLVAQILGQAGILPGPQGARNNQQTLAPSAGAMVVGSSKQLTKKANKQVRNAKHSLGYC